MTGFESKQVQWRWQFDFVAPLVSSAQAQAAQSALMDSITQGQQLTPNANGQITSATGAQQPSVPGSASGASDTAVPGAATNPASFGRPTPYYTPPLSNTLPPNSLGNPTPNPVQPGGAQPGGPWIVTIP
jgi:hypothetical protein